MKNVFRNMAIMLLAVSVILSGCAKDGKIGGGLDIWTYKDITFEQPEYVRRLLVSVV